MTLKRFLLSCLLPLALGWPARADFIAIDGSIPGTVYRVNELTGAFQRIGSASYPGSRFSSLTRDPQSDTFYTVGVNDYSGVVARLFTLDPNTGSTTLVAPLSQSSYIQGLVFAPNGLLYATAYSNDTFYTIDPRTGTVARVGSMGAGYRYVSGLALAPNGTLYGYTYNNAELGTGGPGFFRLDPTTLATTVLTPPGAPTLPLVTDIAFAPDGTLWAASNGTFLQIDSQTGLPAGPSHRLPFFVDTMIFLPAATVPEPSTVLLLGAGLLGLCALRRRNQSR